MANKKSLKILLVSPCCKEKSGGISTWSKTILGYCWEACDIRLCFLNTVQGLPKRWSTSNRLSYLLIGVLDSLMILIRLFVTIIIQNPTVVHFTSSAGNALYKDLMAVWIVKKLFKKKFVIHWHFGRIPAIFQERGTEYKLLTKVCKRSDISIVIDKNSFTVFQEMGIKSVYIPNPISASLQKETKNFSISAIPSKRHLGEILYVGHILTSKGVKELVQACSECYEVNKLILVGPFFDNSFKDELINLSKNRDNGKWLHLEGEKELAEVWNYYKTCSVFCLPSHTEGFPNVILEAMAFSCPIVATTVGAIPEMLSEGCGILVEAMNVNQLKEALSKTLDNLEMAMEMGRKAQARVLENYTIENVYSHYCNVWRNDVLKV